MSLPSSQLTAPPAAGMQTYPFTLADLPFPYDALEPHFDQKTLQVHHRGHHGTYVKKLNEALAKVPELQHRKLSELLRAADLPASIRAAIRNNGGGHFNHDFFWSVLGPNAIRGPQGALARALEETFGSLDEFRRKFSDVAEKHFASGWVALAVDHASKKLEILDLKDHEVVMPGEKTGLLILDVWEHAYYLKYQNRRAEFIQAFWNVVNWPHVMALFEGANVR